MDEATVVAAVAAGHEEYSVFVDLAAGTIAGCSGIIVGQPLDTVRATRSVMTSEEAGQNDQICDGRDVQVKVRLQTHSTFYKGALDCTRQTVRHGPLDHLQCVYCSSWG